MTPSTSRRGAFSRLLHLAAGLVVGLAAIALLAGCSIFERKQVDYKAGAVEAPALEVPPDLTQLARDNRSQVQGGVISAEFIGSILFPGVIVGFFVILIGGRQGPFATFTDAVIGERITFAYGVAGLFLALAAAAYMPVLSAADKGLVGISMPTTPRPGIGATMRIDWALSAIDRSSEKTEPPACARKLSQR